MGTIYPVKIALTGIIALKKSGMSFRIDEISAFECHGSPSVLKWVDSGDEILGGLRFDC